MSIILWDHSVLYCLLCEIVKEISGSSHLCHHCGWDSRRISLSNLCVLGERWEELQRIFPPVSLWPSPLLLINAVDIIISHSIHPHCLIHLTKSQAFNKENMSSYGTQLTRELEKLGFQMCVITIILGGMSCLYILVFPWKCGNNLLHSWLMIFYCKFITYFYTI